MYILENNMCKFVWVCMYLSTCSFQKDGWKATCFYLNDEETHLVTSGGKSDILNFGFVNDNHVF